MTLEKLNKILNNLKKETKKLYNELDEKTDGKYKIGVNGLGEIVLTDISTMQRIAKGEIECQEAMKKLIKGAN